MSGNINHYLRGKRGSRLLPEGETVSMPNDLKASEDQVSKGTQKTYLERREVL